jgi:hypothetical protein
MAVEAAAAGAKEKAKRNTISVTLDDATFAKVQKMAEMDERSPAKWLAIYLRKHFGGGEKVAANASTTEWVGGKIKPDVPYNKD